MKAFSIGLITILALAIVGFFTFKATTSFMSRLASPSPSASPSPTPSISPIPTPSPTPSFAPNPTYKPTTKGGTVKGANTTKTVTKTTTSSHLTLTLVKTSACPVSYMTEVKDITGPLTLRYTQRDGYSFGITVWRADGNELLSNTIYGGTSGTIKTISGVDYMKVRIESKSCSSTADTWLTLTAER